MQKDVSCDYQKTKIKRKIAIQNKELRKAKDGQTHMELQVALDFDYYAANCKKQTDHAAETLEIFSVEIAKKLIADAGESIDIIEVGTPFCMEYGLGAVKALKAAYPEKKVLADLKIADAGYYEAATAYENGADITTVLAVTDDSTILNARDAARTYGREIMADMVAVQNLPERLAQIDAMGVDYICLHTSKDLQRLDQDMTKAFAELRGYVKNAKLALAGGINRSSIQKFASIDPDVIIVGEGITGANDYGEAAAYFKSVMKQFESMEE